MIPIDRGGHKYTCNTYNGGMAGNRVTDDSLGDSGLQSQSTETVIKLFEACLEAAALRARLRLENCRLLRILQRKSHWQSPSPSRDVPVNSGTPETSSTDADGRTAGC